ncbi:MAG: cell division protein SepF [Oscillospiraceae bacterium]|jgi:FtsZ-interacting cell division protein YlmF|nr:cell division protein SepF [Oscillospiraceae bacterium]
MGSGILKKIFTGGGTPHDIYDLPEEDEEEKKEDVSPITTPLTRPTLASVAAAEKVLPFSATLPREPAGHTAEFKVPVIPAPPAAPAPSASVSTASTAFFSRTGGATMDQIKNQAGDSHIVVASVTEFEMSRDVASQLIGGKVVLLNLEECAKDISGRVLDFIGGVAFACDANITRAAGRVFVLAPHGCKTDGEYFDDTAISPDPSGIRY